MIESGYYPPGAEFDPNAPYNQVDPPEHEFGITISQTLSKSTSVCTTDYNYECDADEDGVYTNYNTEDTNWDAAYKDEHLTIEQLLDVLKNMCVLEKSVLEAKLEKDIATKNRIRKLDYYISECDGWCVDETEVIEE